MKRILLLAIFFTLNFLRAEATAGDTIILNQHFYFTIFGIGTEHAQVAVIGNIAPQGFTGMQMAGIFNVAPTTKSCVQIAGVSNHATDSMSGIQLGGCLNTVQGNMRGLQAAGAFNVATGSVYGAQIAGSFNVAAGNVSGAQLSGGANIAWGNVSRLQASGGLNFASNVDGVQITGGANIATGTVRGAQISGGLNYAHNVKGLQLGVVNFADSAEGVMIGVISFARHGYHKLEFGWNETTPVNASFYTGSRIFHNILSTCVDVRPRELVWGFGYGIGTVHRINNRIDVGANLIGYHMNKGSFSASMSGLYKLNLLCDVHLAKGLSLAAGPSLNLFVTDLFPAYDSPVTGIAPYYFFTQTYSNRWNAKAWLGFNASIRFF